MTRYGGEFRRDGCFRRRQGGGAVRCSLGVGGFVKVWLLDEMRLKFGGNFYMFVEIVSKSIIGWIGSETMANKKTNDTWRILTRVLDRGVV